MLLTDARLLALLLDEALAEAAVGEYQLHATRAHLLEMSGEIDAAIGEYGVAAERTNSLPERDYLTKRAASLGQRRARGAVRETITKAVSPSAARAVPSGPPRRRGRPPRRRA